MILNQSSKRKQTMLKSVLLIFNHYDTFRLGVMVFNATFNNISVISWRSVLLVEETGENH
jgi:energy-converting hydrogenase Eha subunit E